MRCVICGRSCLVVPFKARKISLEREPTADGLYAIVNGVAVLWHAKLSPGARRYKEHRCPK